ncbi:MAG: hypothetical protein P8184_18455 [Calditrichia bacterium]
MRRKTLLLAGILLLGWGCSEDSLQRFIPRTLAGLPLRETVTGGNAVSMIAEMHGKPVAPKESAVAHYGEKSGTTATLYLSRYATAAAARSMLAEMSERIGGGGSVFRHHRKFEVNGRPVEMVLGLGQVHFFFAKDRILCWLAADVRHAAPALAQLLEAEIGDIPFPVQAN